MEKNKIEEMIIESLKETAGLIKEGTCSSKIIIPDYRTRKNIKEEDVKEGDEKEKRYSEQELKQIFLNQIEKDDSPFLYSVETPSKLLYSFKEELNVSFEKKKEHFLSSRIDVSLYDNSNTAERQLVSHIEFKYGQCEKDAIQKDFLKLICESMDGIGNYFVQYLSSIQSKTKYAIFNKYKESLKSIKDNNAVSEKNQKIDDIDKMKTVFVYVMFVGLKPEDKYEIYKISMKELDEFDLQENNVENCLEKYKLFPRNDA